MNISLHNNLLMMNAGNQYKINAGKEKKAAEKLTSGFRINRSADDAAGLQISEKMRAQIRGLRQGSENARDGISWLQTGEGALGEVHAMLHRMKELTVKSLNDTNTLEDRAAMQAEFDALQSEMDHIFDTTEFNNQKIFADHEPTYYQFEGNVVWQQSQPHVISGGANDLIIECLKDGSGSPETITVTVPAGVYTTQELIDELDDAMAKSGAREKGLVMEYTQDGTCNLNFEGGEKIESVGGGLAYLLYDVYEGGSMGALIGTTGFNETSKLEIASANNQLSFEIESSGGTSKQINITFPSGKYTRQQLIDMLNEKLKGTSVKAIAYGTGIKLTSEDSIITRFKGNMFKVDEKGKEEVYTSVFYDNVKYGNIVMGAASFQGGAVLPTEKRDEEHKYYEINAGNNQLNFQANGSSQTVTITIPDGKYTASEMAAKLNQLFAGNNLELNASFFSSGGYQGIRIDSTVKGTFSKVGLNKNSSAFDTLFVDRKYNAYVVDAAWSREEKDDKGAVFKGAKSFTGSALPLEITGANNTFRLSLTNASGTSTHTITLAAGSYTTAQAVADAINAQLTANTAPIAYKGLVKATVENGKIVLNGADGVTAVSASASSGSSGYNDIFVLNKVNYVKQDISGSTVTTNTPIPDGTVIKPGDNTLQVSVSGNGYNITLPTGNNVTHDAIADAIEKAVQEKQVTSPNTFSNVNGRGSSTDDNFDESAVGNTVVKSENYTGVGSSQNPQGDTTVFEYNNPAKVTITPVLSETTVISKENNQLQLQILKDGPIKSITIPDGAYNRQGLAKAIQSQIDAAFGKYYGGAVVSVNSSGQLELEARLNQKGSANKGDGAETKISCSTGTSSFLKELNTTRTAAQIASDVALKSSITIADECNSLSFSYTENGVSKTADIVLSNGNYTRAGIRDEINKKLKAAGIGVTAGLSGSYLTLENNLKGKGNSISFNTRTGGSAVEALFGDLTSEQPARATVNLDMQGKINIDSTSNTFQMKVNGNPCNLTLDSGEYSRSEFADMLNQKFKDANVGITATLNGKRLAFETDKKGSGASFDITYGTGGTSMKAIYGETTTVIPGLKASFTPDGRLSLTSTTGNANIKISSDSGGVFQQPLAVPETVNPTSSGGYYSKKNCYIDGVNLSEPVTIDEWNNDLKFNYYADGKRSAISVSVPQKKYTFAELQTELQNLLDKQMGQNQVEVTVRAAGVRIETVKTGSKYYMADFAGDFYDKVLCSTKERSAAQTTQEKNGSQSNDLAFTVGRKDVRNQPVELKKGFSDTLTLDFTYGGTTKTLNMQLTPGVYDGDSLTKEIQAQLNKALVNAGLEANTIEVGIGGVNTGVDGSNDSNALVFKLSSSVRLPVSGQYIIDGVGGNAAFSVFYQTDGKMDPAYIKGSRDISGGAVIEAGEEEFSFEADGAEYRILIPQGTYTSKEVIDTVNQQLRGSGAPVTAEEEDGRLVLRHNNLGSHKIGNVKGAAKQKLFFQENGVSVEKKGIMLQLSGKLPDYAVMEQQAVNTVFLGINSITISAPKYAEKALSRLDGALDKVSEIRSDFGSKQNQLERAINNNGNEEENVQSAESRLRDSDMAKEMVDFSKANILRQTAQAMMAQSDLVSEGVLKLLQ